MEEEGLMRTRTFWLTWLLAAATMLLPLAAAPGQEVPPADPVWPFPIYHDRPEKGGLFVDGDYVMYRQTNPLAHQPIAFRGFFDNDGSFTGQPGAIIGSGRYVLFADDAGGPGTYQPGFRVGIGWRFEDGISVELSWLHLMKAQYFAVVSGVSPPGFRSDPQLADTFLSSPVFNFPPEFSGPLVKEVALANIFPHSINAGFGIWNAADVMSIEFDQRYEQADLNARIPIFETDCDRCYGLVGGRAVWIWERFKWRTVDLGFSANTDFTPGITVGNFGRVFPVVATTTPTLSIDQDPRNAAVYTNIVSNRLYGPTIGLGNEWYCGHGFAVSVDVQGGLFLDVVKERAKYEPGLKDAGPQSKRSITTWTAAPEAQAGITLWWYPIEGIQVQLGYDFMSYFNTRAAPNPVSFNYGGLDPAWESKYRFFDGLRAGLGIIF
jgi:hypothetical protein